MKYKTSMLRKLVVVLVVSIFFAFTFISLSRYFVLDKNAIQNEVASLNLPSSFKKQNEQYSRGGFENSPSLEIKYSIPYLINSQILDNVESIFEASGYHDIRRGDNSIRGYKDNGRYFAEAFTLRGNSYQNVKGDIDVDTFILRITYNPSISK